MSPTYKTYAEMTDDEKARVDADEDAREHKKESFVDVPREPPPGSWAETARAMAQMFPDDGFDWDAWKDEMKEGES